MAGKKGMKGGGARPNSGGARKGAGRPPGITGTPGKKEGTVDVMPRELSITERKWAYAEQALKHAARMLDILVEIAEDTEQSGSARVAAADKILDRALGKAPAHVDISAIRYAMPPHLSPPWADDPAYHIGRTVVQHSNSAKAGVEKGRSRQGGASCRSSHVRNAPLATVGLKKAACRDGPRRRCGVPSLRDPWPAPQPPPRRSPCWLSPRQDRNRLELSRLEPTRYHKISHNPMAIKRLFVDLFLD